MFGSAVRGEAGNRGVQLTVWWLEEILKPQGMSVDTGEKMGGPLPWRSGALWGRFSQEAPG